jgi:hypothetical protein
MLFAILRSWSIIFHFCKCFKLFNYHSSVQYPSTRLLLKTRRFEDFRSSCIIHRNKVQSSEAVERGPVDQPPSHLPLQRTSLYFHTTVWWLCWRECSNTAGRAWEWGQAVPVRDPCAVRALSLVLLHSSIWLGTAVAGVRVLVYEVWIFSEVWNKCLLWLLRLLGMQWLKITGRQFVKLFGTTLVAAVVLCFCFLQKFYDLN